MKNGISIITKENEIVVKINEELSQKEILDSVKKKIAEIKKIRKENDLPLFITGKNLSDVIYKVNSEATIEIAKQIRLRDIGGIIIIDYIDMLREGDKEKIENLLKQELKEDRAKTQVEGFTKLDLMELTRKHICSHKG